MKNLPARKTWACGADILWSGFVGYFCKMARCSKKQNTACCLFKKKTTFSRKFYQFSKVFFPHEDHAVKKKLHRLGDTENSREIREKSGENDWCIGSKMTCCRWKMRSRNYCKLWLSRPSLAKLSNQLHLLIIKQETFERQWPSISSVKGLFIALLLISLVLPYRRCALSFTKKQKPTTTTTNKLY